MATSLHLSGSCARITLPLSRTHAESVGPAPPPHTAPFFNRLPPPRPLLSLRKLQNASPPLLLSSKTRAVAKESSAKETTEKCGTAEGKYYFLVANANFLLDEEEHFKEVLFERLRHLNERKKEQDFWLVVEPKFLDRFPSLTNRLLRPAVALVSTDPGWISFVRLKLDRVLSSEYESESLQEALACNPTELRFPPPKKWEAPYPKYEFGWWERFFLPSKADSQN
ncbi:Uncharacterized protein EJ110_NYTH10697 [Nymphaea thermarum]|nr:Uncharacterized protein EJ110_NYTH10697 [Nymphaea thermarum]